MLCLRTSGQWAAPCLKPGLSAVTLCTGGLCSWQPAKLKPSGCVHTLTCAAGGRQSLQEAQCHQHQASSQADSLLALLSLLPRYSAGQSRLPVPLAASRFAEALIVPLQLQAIQVRTKHTGCLVTQGVHHLSVRVAPDIPVHCRIARSAWPWSVSARNERSWRKYTPVYQAHCRVCWSRQAPVRQTSGCSMQAVNQGYMVA